ncbi:MAG: hypothetical protein ACHQ2F_10000 [Desulfobaccales bacterium]
MSLNRWLSVILMLGLILALSPLGAQADPYQPFDPHPYYHHPHGNAYGWDAGRHHDFDRHREYSRGSWGPHHPRPYVQQVYAAPPVAYVAPVAPVFGIQACPQQPYYSQPAPPGLHGQVNFGF